MKEMYDYKVSGSSQTLYHYVYNTYDGLKRLASQAEVNGSSVPLDLSPYTVTYTYDLKDRLSNGDTANYLLLSYSYDAFGRVTDLQYSKAGEKVEQHSYVYDKNSSITKESNLNTLSGLDEIRAYTYDNLNQLTTSVFKNVITETVTVEGKADEEGNPTTTTQTVTREEDALTISYTYDIVGNRIRKKEDSDVTSYFYQFGSILLAPKPAEHR